jgi:dihydrofolate synthase/folylpolyglutamate synthase
MLTHFELFFKNTGEFKNLELTLNRIEGALKEIGFDESKLGRIIHIAGTNGKGSTAHFLSQILEKNGYKTALYTSPHIENICERILINNVEISSKAFDDTFDALSDIIKKYNLSYFEALTLIAFHIFTNEQVDVSIIETGLGGTYDATNILNKKIPVITTISQDHKNYLGSSIYKIIDEKLNIVKENKNVYVGKNREFIKKYIKGRLYDKNICFAEENIDSSIPKPYSCNLSLVKSIVENEFHLRFEEDFPVKLPYCRMERIDRFILDGAHNPNGVISILENIKDIDTVIISSTKDRDIYKIVNILKQKIKNIIITEIFDNDRSIKIEEIKNIDKIIKIKKLEDAIDKALELAEINDILVCGSFYLCGQTRKILREKIV